MSEFNSVFEKIIKEMTSASVLGDVSTHGGAVGNSDFYAKGETRIPMGGAVYTRAGKLTTNKKNKKGKRRKK